MNTSGLSITVLSVDNGRMRPRPHESFYVNRQKGYWPETAPCL